MSNRIYNSPHFGVIDLEYLFRIEAPKVWLVRTMPKVGYTIYLSLPFELIKLKYNRDLVHKEERDYFFRDRENNKGYTTIQTIEGEWLHMIKINSRHVYTVAQANLQIEIDKLSEAWKAYRG